MLKTDGFTRVVFVMEECRDDLRSTIFNNPKKCPGKSDIEAALVVCRWLKDITAALDYIHEQGIVHRDFKLANILVCNLVTVRIKGNPTNNYGKHLPEKIDSSPAILKDTF